MPPQYAIRARRRFRLPEKPVVAKRLAFLPAAKGKDGAKRFAAAAPACSGDGSFVAVAMCGIGHRCPITEKIDGNPRA
jgi:hypothetical protein